MEQVLMNICLNARDAMPDGGLLKIETEMITLDDSFCHFYPGVLAGTYVVLSICDTGVGMSRKCGIASSNLFLRRKSEARVQGWGWPRSTESSGSTADSFMSTASRAGQPVPCLPSGYGGRHC